MITRHMLRTDMPPVLEKDGYANVVLALCADCYYTPNGSNSYLPRWQTMSAIWYRNNTSNYLGWIELEDIGMPQFTNEVTTLQISDTESA